MPENWWDFAYDRMTAIRRYVNGLTNYFVGPFVYFPVQSDQQTPPLSRGVQPEFGL
jgi:hypothetical protein